MSVTFGPGDPRGHDGPISVDEYNRRYMHKPPAMHVLTQDEDAQGYGDGLEDWECSCGETFSAAEIPEAYQHGYETAADIGPRKECSMCGAKGKPWEFDDSGRCKDCTT